MLSPAIDEAIRWFHWTHDLEQTFGSARWVLARLPGPGALGQQDARVMQTLEYLRFVANQLLAKRPKTGADDELKQYHAGRTRDRG